MKRLEDFTDKDVIHCPTEELANKICKLLHDKGFTWYSGSSYIGHNNWRPYQEETCYRVLKGEYSPKNFYENEGCTIHKAEDILVLYEEKLPEFWVLKAENKEQFDEVLDYFKQRYKVNITEKTYAQFTPKHTEFYLATTFENKWSYNPSKCIEYGNLPQITWQQFQQIKNMEQNFEEYIVECKTAEESNIVASHIKEVDYDCALLFRYVINSKILGKDDTLYEYIPDNCSHLPVLTFKQFQQKIMKETKIIGYKCPTDLFNGIIKAGTVYTEITYKKTYQYGPKGVTVNLYDLPKEIVETWEAVLEEEFKVGDWIYFIKSFDSVPIGHIAKIISLDVENAYQVGLQWLSYSPKQGYGGGFRVGGNGYFLNKDFRKATQQEIDSLFTKTLTLSNGKEVLIKKGVIAGQNEIVKLEDLVALTQWSPLLRINSWNASINAESVNIGCWKKIKISDLELIIKTAEEQIELMS